MQAIVGSIIPPVGMAIAKVVIAAVDKLKSTIAYDPRGGVRIHPDDVEHLYGTLRKCRRW